MISDRLLRKINAYHIQEVEPRLPCNQESSPRQRARTLASSTVKRKSRDGKKETLFRRTSSLDKVKDLVENVSTDSKGGQHQLQDDGEDFPDEFHFFEKHVLPLSSQSNIYSVFLFGKTEDGTDRWGYLVANSSHLFTFSFQHIRRLTNRPRQCLPNKIRQSQFLRLPITRRVRRALIQPHFPRFPNRRRFRLG